MAIHVKARVSPDNILWEEKDYTEELTVSQLLEDVIPEKYHCFTDMSSFCQDLPAETAKLNLDPRVIEAHEQAIEGLEGVCCYEVRVNDEVVEREAWTVSMLEEGDVVVVQLRPAGLFDAIKKALIVAIVIFIVVFVAYYFFPTAAVEAGAAAAEQTLLEYAMSSAFFQAGIAAMLTLVAGFLAPSLDQAGGQGGGQTYRLDGIGNRARHWGPAPKLFGTFKFWPLQAARLYHEIVGEDTFIRFLFTFGQGDVEVSDIKLGEQEIRKYKGVEYKVHRNTGTSNLTIYQGTRRQDSLAVVLNTEWQTITTRTGCTEALVNVNFPLGLGEADSKNPGAVLERSVTIDYEWRKVGGSYEASGDSAVGTINYVYSAYGRVEREKSTYTRKASSGLDNPAAVRQGHRATQAVCTGSGKTLRCTYPTGTSSSGSVTVTDYGAFYFYMASSGQYARPGTVTQNNGFGRGIQFLTWDEDYSFLAIHMAAGASPNKSLYVLNADGGFSEFDFLNAQYLDSGSNFRWTRNEAGSTIRSAMGSVDDGETLQIRIADRDATKSQVFSDETRPSTLISGFRRTRATHKAATRSPQNLPIRITFSSKGQYEIRLRRTTTESDLIHIFERATVNFLQSIQPDSPVTYSGGMTYIEGRIQASEQLAGTVDALNAICKARIPVYDGTNWNLAVTDNPAWICCYILKDGPFGVPDAQLDLTSWRSFAAFCDSGGYKWNGVIDQSQTKDDAVKLVLDVAHATLSRPNGKYSVIWNDPNEPISQLFSPRTVSTIVQNIEYVDDLHGMRVAYIDPNVDWTQQEVAAYKTGYSESNAERFEALENIGITNKNQAVKYARWKLSQRLLRPSMYTFTSPFDHLVCTRGSRVLLQGFTITDRYCSARVSKVVVNNQNKVVELYPDVAPEADIPLNTDMTCRVSNENGLQSFTAQWSGSPDYKFTVLASANVTNVDPGNHMTVGKPDSDVVELRVESIEYSDIALAGLTCIDWNITSLRTSEATGSIPDYSPFLSSGSPPFLTIQPPPVPRIDEVRGDDTAVERLQDGTYDPGIVIRFDYVDGNAEDYYLVITAHSIPSSDNRRQKMEASLTSHRFGQCLVGYHYRIVAWHERKTDGKRSNTVSRTVFVTGYNYDIPGPDLFTVRETAGIALRHYSWTYNDENDLGFVKDLKLEYREDGTSAWTNLLDGRIPVGNSPYETTMPEATGDYDIRVTPYNHVGDPGASVIHSVTFSANPTTIGSQGPQGIYEVKIYRKVDDSVTLTAAPSGGSHSGGTTTPPDDWTNVLPAQEAGKKVYQSVATYNPATSTLSSWSAPFEVGAEGPAGPQGPQGLRGLPGADGTDGLPGTDGTDGEPGEDGDDGTDGVGVEYIFTAYSSATLPSDRYPSNSWGYDEGGTAGSQVWTDAAPNVSATNPYLFRAERKIIGQPSEGDSITDNWSTPKVVGRHGPTGAAGPRGIAGRDGTDGAPGVGLEYVFARYNSETLPTGLYPKNAWGYDSPVEVTDEDGQTVTIARQYSYGGASVTIEPAAGSRPQITEAALLPESGDRYFAWLRIYAATGNIELYFASGQTGGTGFSQGGDDLSDDFESGGTITLSTAGYDDLVIDMPGTDMSEPYTWTPTGDALTRIKTYAAAQVARGSSNFAQFDIKFAVPGESLTWFDNAPSLDADHQYLFRDQRRITGNPAVGTAVTAQWAGPTVVGRYGAPGIAGEDGADGDPGEDGVGREYVFAAWSATTVPLAKRPKASWGFDNGGVADGLRWHDAAPGLSVTFPYLLRAERPVTGSPDEGDDVHDSNGNDVAFTVPTVVGRWGPPGTDGSDGAAGTHGLGIEYIYAVYNSSVLGASRFPNNDWRYDQNTNAPPNGRGERIAGGLTWHDSAQDVSETNPYLYMSWRNIPGNLRIDDVVPSQYTWKAPKIIGHWGADGGEGIQIIYQVTATNTRPTQPTSLLNQRRDNNYVPTGWSRDAPDVSSTMPYLWATERRGNSGNWGEWGSVRLSARYGSDGTAGAAGTRGAGTYSATIDGNAWSDTAANEAVPDDTPVPSDRVTLVGNFRFNGEDSFHYADSFETGTNFATGEWQALDEDDVVVASNTEWGEIEKIKLWNADLSTDDIAKLAAESEVIVFLGQENWACFKVSSSTVASNVRTLEVSHEEVFFEPTRECLSRGLFRRGSAGFYSVDDNSAPVLSQWNETRFWDGDSWEAVTVHIPGNLLIAGTVGAEALVVDRAVIGSQLQLAPDVIDISHFSPALVELIFGSRSESGGNDFNEYAGASLPYTASGLLRTSSGNLTITRSSPTETVRLTGSFQVRVGANSVAPSSGGGSRTCYWTEVVHHPYRPRSGSGKNIVPSRSAYDEDVDRDEEISPIYRSDTGYTGAGGSIRATFELWVSEVEDFANAQDSQVTKLDGATQTINQSIAVASEQVVRYEFNEVIPASLTPRDADRYVFYRFKITARSSAISVTRTLGELKRCSEGGHRGEPETVHNRETITSDVQTFSVGPIGWNLVYQA